jgi:hypothetical protein
MSAFPHSIRYFTRLWDEVRLLIRSHDERKGKNEAIMNEMPCLVYMIHVGKGEYDHVLVKTLPSILNSYLRYGR